MTEAEKAARTRKRLFAQITHIESLAISDVNTAKTRLVQLDEIWTNFQNVQATIENVFVGDDNDEDFDANLAKRMEFEDKFLALKSSLAALARPTTPVNPVDTPSTSRESANEIRQRPKLPQISLPTFAGKTEEFPSFLDIFDSTIDKDEYLDDVQKLTYLKLSLKDEALELVKHLSTTHENYVVARELLRNRYENKKILVNKHIHNIVTAKKSGESAAELKNLIDTFRSNISGLHQCGDESQNSILVYHILAKLPPRIREDWEMHGSENEIDDIAKIYQFLESKIRGLTAANQFEIVKNRPTIRAHTSSAQKEQCLVCKEPHATHSCAIAVKKDAKSLYEIVKSAKACLNCLRIGHLSQDCTRPKCKKCEGKHHTLLHFGQKAKTPETSSEKTTIQATSAVGAIKPGILATISLYAENPDHNGGKILARALFDPGSEGCLITSKLAKKLDLSLKHDTTIVTGIGNIKTESRQCATLRISSRTSSFSQSIDAVVLKSLVKPYPSSSLPHPSSPFSNLKLADPKFFETGPIDIILGVELMPEILRPGCIKSTRTAPGAVHTAFGWVVCGAAPNSAPRGHIASNLTISDSLTKFWELEEVPARKAVTAAENTAEQHFVETTTRLPSGRFVVRLPFAQPPELLGESRETAVQILKSVTKRLTPSQLQSYKNFMSEYESLGHMSRIDEEKIGETPHCYLPHHAVFKNGVTSKIRVVFNASKPTKSGKSLNDILMVGPTIQDELFDILIRFRFYAIGICSDAEKMYRQIVVAEEHRQFQRIVWFNVENEVKDYELNTVTYGTAPASFLATRAVQELAKQESSLTVASPVALRDFYVDDLITGADSTENASALVGEMNELMNRGGFALRKWASNDTKVFDRLANIELEHFVLYGEVGTLGLHWCTQSDRFRIASSLSDDTPTTKRSVLAESARLFDPLGILAPIVIKSKILLQKLWLSGVGWDDKIPMEIESEWARIRRQLSAFAFEVPRRVSFNNTNFQVHGFCDASQEAYAACLYVCSIDASDGTPTSRLLCSKTRVAPLKTVSIPRLELCGALLLAKLLTRVMSSIPFEPTSIHLWTDSTIVLSWLRKQPSLLKTFVANRVSEIVQQTHPEMWRHIPGTENPADLASRGLFPDAMSTTLWWNGPSFLNDLSQQSWPVNTFVENPDCQTELRPVVIKTFSSSIDHDWLGNIVTRFSNYRSLTHVVAYCIRFVNNAKLPKNSRNLGSLSQVEIDHAIDCLSRFVQSVSFAPDIEKLSRKGSVGKRSKIASLAPFLDDRRVLRVGGRLKNANLEFSETHPIILPPNHHFTTILIRQIHLDLMHGSHSVVLATIRLRFWILHSKNAVKKVLNGCVLCRRLNARTSSQIMGQLPLNRVNASLPFLHVGVDLSGFFEIRNSLSNSRSFVKAYFVVFVCFQTKAIHLELVSSLASNSFLLALSNFIARRGRCNTIYSDNGTNFVGADRELKALFENIEPACAQKAIEWAFIPPRAPHMGGLWEAAVKLVKKHLYSTVKSTKSITFEEMYSVLARIESCLNSRPLTPMSDDINDLTALTPGHFLVGRSLQSIPASNSSEIKIDSSLRDRFKLTQGLVSHFWARWSTEYLRSLQTRSKWQRPQKNFEVGDLVVVCEENVATMEWMLGRVVETHKGKDDLVRVCSVKTASGLVKRSIAKLAPILSE